MSEYLLFYKERLPLVGSIGRWDVSIAAFNSSPRVRLLAERVQARQRHWLLLPEYGYSESDCPADGSPYSAGAGSEVQFLDGFLRHAGITAGTRIVVDISGMINNYVIALLALLRQRGIKQCDMIYAEPERYRHSERTRFSDEVVVDVRQIGGFEGIHSIDTRDDLLVLATGYDYRLVAEVANKKEHARKVQIFGLPSLRPDMYQESLLRMAKVAEAVGPDGSVPQHFEYAPANDPFVTAHVMARIVARHRAQHPKANVYLAPLSTKPQALGCALYFMRECVGGATSILYPMCNAYMRETSDGLSGIWRYRVELDCLSPVGAEA